MRATTDRLPSSKATIFYPPSILEEELKNRVAVDWFGAFDCSHILGKVDFCATVPATDLPLCDAESVLWAEAKRGAEAPLDFALVQLILTIGKERTFDKHLPPKYLAAFNAARIAFIPYSEVVEIFYQNDFNWNVAPSDHETREFGDLYQRVIRILESATLEFDFAKDEAELRRFIKANLNTGRELWRYYHAQPNANPNASFYDIRLHFQGSTTDAKGKVRMNSESIDEKYTELIGNLRTAMKSLARRIEPKVYEYGFLKR